MFFAIKARFVVKYEKITLFDEFLVLLGPIISRFFACSNEEKNKQKQQRVLALILSLCVAPLGLLPSPWEGGIKSCQWGTCCCRREMTTGHFFSSSKGSGSLRLMKNWGFIAKDPEEKKQV